MNLIPTEIPTERLDAIIDGTLETAEHIRVLALAIRHGGVTLSVIPQGRTPFRDNDKRPTIFLIGDDTGRALGPDGFHMPSIRRAIRQCAGFSVISCAPMVEAYGPPAGAAALLGQNVMIVETRLEHEADWYNLIQRLAPNCPILLSTVKVGGHA
ncbi:hypothetical protein [Phyllobacterium sp. SB3]|uniref:hypothetical protein n=1 Tax=Phyllobacterium sp. SB3 TaxID=3156073 RepID=UPI0032AFEE3D